jgi:hypothetical protein
MPDIHCTLIIKIWLLNFELLRYYLYTYKPAEHSYAVGELCAAHDCFPR